jgi:hypothetical protein
MGSSVASDEVADLPQAPLPSSPFGRSTEAPSRVCCHEMTVRYDKNHKKAAPGQPFRALHLFLGVKMAPMRSLEE